MLHDILIYYYKLPVFINKLTRANTFCLFTFILFSPSYIKERWSYFSQVIKLRACNNNGLSIKEFGK